MSTTESSPPVKKSRWKRRLKWLVGIAAVVWAVGFFFMREREPYVPPPVIKRPTRVGAEHPLDRALDIAYRQKRFIVDSVTDYTATVVKRERIKGKLGETQTLFVKVRNRKRNEKGEIIVPMAVYLKFTSPDNVKGREVIWVEGANKNKLIAHETGFKNLLKVKLAPTSLVAMIGNKYPITEIGIENLVDKLITRGEEGRRHEDTEVNITKDVEFKGRKCTVIEVVHPEKSPKFLYHMARIHLDQELNVPIKYASYLWPEEPGGERPLDEEYFYDDLKLNVGIKDDEFDPDNPDYDYPKW